MPETLYLIDGHAQIYRAFYAVEGLTAPDGAPTGAVFGFTRMLLDLDRKHRPDYLVAVFDAPGPTFRHREFPEYKATRKPPPDDLIKQIPVIQKVVAAYRIPVVEQQGFEADDLLGTLAKQGEAAGLDVVIVTGDKDCGQLLSPRIRIYDAGKDRFLDAAGFEEQKGLPPDKLPDLMGLWGDKSDNIPGVPGIGEKIGAELIRQYGSLEKLLDYAHEVKGKRGEVLRAHRDQARLSKKLATIRVDAPVALDLAGAKRQAPDYPRLQDLFEKLNFRSLQRQLEDFRRAAAQAGDAEAAAAEAAAGNSAAPVTRRYKLVNTPEAFAEFFAEFEKRPRFALDTETTGDKSLDPMRADLVGISIAWRDGEAYYLPFRGPTAETVRRALEEEEIHNAKLRKAAKKSAKNAAGGDELFAAEAPEAADGDDDGVGADIGADIGADGGADKDAEGFWPIPREVSPVLGAAEWERLKPILENDRVAKLGHNLKFDVLVLRRAGAFTRGQTFDTLIANSLTRHGLASQKLDAVARRHLDETMTPITELIGQGRRKRRMDEAPLEQIRDYAAEDADMVWRLAPVLSRELGEQGMDKLFNDLEMPLSFILTDMQATGIRVDPGKLEEQSRELGDLLERLREELHRLAGHAFNPDSPKQLVEVLFREMGLPTQHRTPSGDPSTDESALAALAAQGHEIAEIILEYRGYAKLKGTYLDALPALVHPATGRVHTTFSQTVTATGRLSSSNPNLQNIPVRSDRGRAVRAAFIPEDGWKMLAADYSQVELRMLAHFSGDPALREAFAAGRDIHRAVAAEVAGVPEYEVSKEMRSAAKAVNFGIVYGQTAYGLAETTGMTPAAAQKFITGYFDRYPSVREWLDRAVAQARHDGYVRTLLGRRRTLPDLRSAKKNNVARAEREAVNTIIQGSAADLIKTAMVNLDRRMRRDRLRARMLLQIHDELLFEAPPGEIDALSHMVREEMERALPLDVALVVDLGVGDNWLEVK